MSIFLGGTGTDNELDDYETGTWTPSANGFTASGTYHANYTKIGRTVHITMWVQTASGSSGSPFYISGLPFTVKGSNTYQYMCGRLGSGGHTNHHHQIVSLLVYKYDCLYHREHHTTKNLLEYYPLILQKKL